jgi:hypothetical protein
MKNPAAGPPLRGGFLGIKPSPRIRQNKKGKGRLFDTALREPSVMPHFKILPKNLLNHVYNDDILMDIGRRKNTKGGV